MAVYLIKRILSYKLAEVDVKFTRTTLCGTGLRYEKDVRQKCSISTNLAEFKGIGESKTHTGSKIEYLLIFRVY